MPGNVSPPAVAVFEDVWGPEFDRLATEVGVLRVPVGRHRPEDLPEVLAGVRAVVVRNQTRVDRPLLAGCPSLLIVGRVGSGLDNIDVAAAEELGVVVSAAVGANAVSVAEHTLGLALAVARRVVPLDRAVRAGRWDRQAGRELHGLTWGLLGYGATGQAVAKLVRGLGMRVMAHDPYVTAEEARHPLHEVVRRADVLSIHLPATPTTRHLVDAALLSTMKPDAILINVGRGEVLDESALADALAHRRLLGAALDVRASEPPATGPLDSLDNVVLTPHVAGITTASQARIAEMIVADLRAVLDGGVARAAVGLQRPKRDSA